MIRQSTSSRGFTALEILIVLLVGFSILGLAAGKMSQMSQSSKTMQAYDSVLQLMTSIKHLGANANYGTRAGDPLTELLIKSDLYPPSLKLDTDNNRLLNQWNGDVQIKVAQDDVKRVHVIYGGVPKAVCPQLAKELAVNYGAVHVTRGPEVGLATENKIPVPVTPDGVMKICGAAGAAGADGAAATSDVVLHIVTN